MGRMHSVSLSSMSSILSMGSGVSGLVSSVKSGLGLGTCSNSREGVGFGNASSHGGSSGSIALGLRLGLGGERCVSKLAGAADPNSNPTSTPNPTSNPNPNPTPDTAVYASYDPMLAFRHYQEALRLNQNTDSNPDPHSALLLDPTPDPAPAPPRRLSAVRPMDQPPTPAAHQRHSLFNAVDDARSIEMYSEVGVDFIPIHEQRDASLHIMPTEANFKPDAVDWAGAEAEAGGK